MRFFLIAVPDEATECASIQHFPEDVQNSLSSIAEWLNFNNRDEFMNVYAVVRGNCMKRSLDSLRDHAKALSGNTRGNSHSPSMIRKYSSPIVANEGTPTSANKNYMKSISKRMTKVTTQIEAKTGLKRNLGTPQAELEGPQLHEMEVDAFLLILSALQHLMSSEQTLMAGIIPHQYQKPIFEKITRESLDLVIRDADAIISRVKKASSPNDYLALISIFQVVKHLQFLKQLSRKAQQKTKKNA